MKPGDLVVIKETPLGKEAEAVHSLVIEGPGTEPYNLGVFRMAAVRMPTFIFSGNERTHRIYKTREQILAERLMGLEREIW